MRKAVLLALAAGLVATGCARVGRPPSLQPRAAERIDPRLPVTGAVNARPVSPALAARLQALVAQARRGDADFRPLAAEADRLSSQAGAPQSESWIAAQQALSAAAAARAPTTRALGDIDALAAEALQSQGGLAPADLAAIQEAAVAVSSLDRSQTAAMERVQGRLGL